MCKSIYLSIYIYKYWPVKSFCLNDFVLSHFEGRFRCVLSAWNLKAPKLANPMPFFWENDWIPRVVSKNRDKTLKMDGENNGKPYWCFFWIPLPSLKLTANALKNWWLEYFLVSFWGPAYFQGVKVLVSGNEISDWQIQHEILWGCLASVWRQWNLSYFDGFFCKGLGSMLYNP